MRLSLSMKVGLVSLFSCLALLLGLFSSTGVASAHTAASAHDGPGWGGYGWGGSNCYYVCYGWGGDSDRGDSGWGGYGWGGSDWGDSGWSDSDWDCNSDLFFQSDNCDNFFFHHHHHHHHHHHDDDD